MKDTYCLLMRSSIFVDNIIYRSCWKLLIPHNVAMFMWKLAKNKVATRSNLKHRNINKAELDHLCPMCHLEEEDNNHLLFACSFSQKIWQNCYNWIGVQLAQHCEPIQYFHMHTCYWLGKSKTIIWRVMWCAMVWSIWCHKNKIIFEGVELDFDDTMEHIRLREWSWLATKVNNFSYSFYEWYMNPTYCIQLLMLWTTEGVNILFVLLWEVDSHYNFFCINPIYLQCFFTWEGFTHMGFEICKTHVLYVINVCTTGAAINEILFLLTQK